MRFQVGQQIPVISFLVEGENMSGHKYQRSTNFFLPWEERVVSCEIVYLTVTEHHKVPSEWDQENKLECDSYILETQQGEKWYNQYPRASYGQISDEADRIFHQAEYNKENQHFYYANFFSYLEKVQRGIYQLNEQGKQEFVETLQKHYDELSARYTEVTGKKLICQNHVVKYINGNTRVMKDWFDVYPEDELKAA